MPRRSDSRHRMIEAAVDLLRRRGYHATAFSDVIRESGAPRGSIYFHFPGGKDELVHEAIAAAAVEIEESVALAASRAKDPASFVRIHAGDVGRRLESSGYESGCAIATMVLELAPWSEQLTAEFAQAFERWRRVLASRFEEWGFPPERALADADLVMAGLEGALVLSRAARSLEPFRRTTEALVERIAADMAAEPRGAPSRKRRAATSRRS
jgi:TetR/AcrR family transcriptional regulator, lmrAB and yxaGH operons repressor